MDISKFDTRTARVIVAQLYVAKRLNVIPIKTIKFIMNNRDYFPDITDDKLNKLKQEKNVSDEDIEKEPDVVFADIQAEGKFENEILEKAKKIDEIRKQEKSKRDYGTRGNTKESDAPNNLYNGIN